MGVGEGIAFSYPHFSQCFQRTAHNPMIDWSALTANALWILGCALALACLSHASWQASRKGSKLGVELQQPAVQVFLNLGGMLFAVGLAWTARRGYETVIWAVLAVLFAIQSVLAGVSLR
jgi:hypothetical protein